MDLAGMRAAAVERARAEIAPSAVDRPAFRAIVVVAIAATLGMTWRLWQVRDGALPNLPAVDVPQLPMAWPLLATLLFTLYRPRWGIAAFTSMLVASMVMDQTRMQPTVVSLTFLLWGTLPSASALVVCRAHLVSLWFFAGAHKLLSPEFVASWGRGAQERLVPGLDDLSLPAVALGLTEMSLGVLMLTPPGRRFGAWLVGALHIGILLLLGPLGRDVNSAVWAWNLALALSGFVYFSRWRTSPKEALVRFGWPTRMAALVIAVAPAGYYVGIVDAYLAHCLYSKNTPRAEYHGERVIDLSMREVNVPMPPEHRLYEQLFERTAEPGDELRIQEPLTWAARDGRVERTLESGPAEH